MLDALIGEPGLHPGLSPYRREFLRLVDKALREYQMARLAILAQIAEGQRSVEEMTRDGRSFPILAFTDHFETCLNAANRAFKVLDSIKAGLRTNPVPKEQRAALRSLQQQLKEVRGEFEHMNKVLAKATLPDTASLFIAVSGDDLGAEVGATSLSFVSAADALSRLHRVGLTLLNDTH
jgi:hypothetical protein